MNRIVKINTIDDAENLALLASGYKEKVDMYQDGVCISAKSAMALFTFNFLKPMLLECENEEFFNNALVQKIIYKGA